MTKRSFDEISVVESGWQGLQDRFGSEPQFNLPPLSQWRCNLTGLSQVHNLYFVAYGKSIYVYVPQFPSQKIARQPSLIFTSQPSSQGLSGYIDPRNPHAINYLIVAPFGTEEVIAVVRDDGDVDAFLTRHIVQAIDRRAEADSTIGIDGDEIRPFFQSNVGSTAWGLAIHTEARILATSSNAHEVKVFKFGLLQTDSSEASPEDGDEDPDAAFDASTSHRRFRSTDVTHHVLNGQANIPYISFCNTGDDPEARWLLTTDIEGTCRVMDLHALEAVQAFRFGRSVATAHIGNFDRLNAGWAIMFLDQRSFRPQHDAHSALGAEGDCERNLPKVHRNGDIWDLSNTARKLDEFAEPFMPYSSRFERRNGRTQAVSAHDSESSPTVEPVDQNFNLDLSNSIELADSSDDGGADVDIDIDIEDGSDEDDSGGIDIDIHGSEMYIDDEHNSEHETADEEGDEGLNETMSNSSSDSNLEQPQRIGEILPDEDDPDDEGTEDTTPYTSFYGGDSIVGNDPRFVHPHKSICDGLPCPILHASVRNVYLLQPSRKAKCSSSDDMTKATAAFHPPMIGLANPLKQPIHQNFGYLRVFERLNMNALIPALGIVILASQKGRALVLSMNKITRATNVPDSLEDFKCGDTSICGMKVEAILPFAEQERQNQRSSYPLHGIAVSPLQGPDGNRNSRWRLIMMYQNHSILSYELSRRAGMRDSGIDIGAVVV